MISYGRNGAATAQPTLAALSYVAAKVLRQSDASSLLRFVRETSLRINHDHLVAPLGWAREDDRVVFAMSIVRGGSVAILLLEATGPGSRI